MRLESITEWKAIDDMRKERVEQNCRNVASKDGTFSPHINKTTTERLTKYCHLINKNKTHFVEQCINVCLDKLEPQYYEQLSKEDLINIILKK